MHGYPTMAKFAAYDFRNHQVNEYWHDTYDEASVHAKSLNADNQIVIGTIFIVEVQR